MVDADPERRAGDSIEHGAETVFNRGVESQYSVERDRFRRRCCHEFRGGQERILIQHAILVPEGDLVSLGAKPECCRNRRPIGIRIRTEMTSYQNAFPAPESLPDFRESDVFHPFELSEPPESISSVGSSGGSVASISSSKLRTRVPRSIDSSRSKCRCGVYLRITRRESSC